MFRFSRRLCTRRCPISCLCAVLKVRFRKVGCSDRCMQLNQFDHPEDGSSKFSRNVGTSKHYRCRNPAQNRPSYVSNASWHQSVLHCHKHHLHSCVNCSLNDVCTICKHRADFLLQKCLKDKKVPCGTLRVLTRPAHGRLTVRSGPLTVRSGPLTVRSQSAHGPLTVCSRSAHSPLTVRSRSVHGPLMVKDIFFVCV